MKQTPNHAEISLIGFLLTLCAAISWALGNVVNKKIAKETPVPLLSLVIWGALLVVPFFCASALWFEGANVFSQVAIHATWQDAGAVAYVAYLATIVGYVLWGNLLARYPAAWVAPITLMVPPVGLTSAYVLLGEQLATWQIVGIITIMLGLLLNVFGGHLSHLFLKQGI